MKKYLLFFSLIIIPVLVQAQRQLSTKSKKAAQYYREADNYWVRNQFQAAEQLFEEAINKDDEFFEAYFKLGLIKKAKGELAKAEEYLSKVVSLQNDHAGANFELGELLIQRGEYHRSIQYTQNYLDLDPRNSQRKAEAQRFLESANYALENIKLQNELNPRPLPDHINQYAMQYFPVITADEKYLIYTRRMGTTMNDDEDLVISEKRDDGTWGEPASISENINSRINEGTCTISADGRTLIFTSCHGRNGYGSCDLYITYKTGDDWAIPKNMGPNVNSSAWDSQPSLSADGRTLYFISNRGKGVGKRDIWVAHLNEIGQWSKPTNLGKVINTKEDEVSPFIHPNNETLYFSSNGRKGFGGFDIYYSIMDDSLYNAPTNLGFPINTGQDQVSLFITSDGREGYYSHENLANPDVKGELYMFDIPEELQVAKKATYVKGRVYDSKSKNSLRAKIELFDLKKDQRVSMVYSDSLNGNYLMVLPEGNSYAFYVEKKGYLFKSLSFQIDSTSSKPMQIDIALDKVVQGEKTVLKNIFFDFDRYELKDESKIELNKLALFLESNPSVQIEIAGHTDNVGDSQYNQELSKKRAKVVYNYLLNWGIESSQMVHEGYGDKRPLVENNSDQNRQNNRRIEFIIQ